MSTEHTTDTEVLPDPEVVEVSEGIYAYIQHDGSWCLNNPAFVDVGDQVIAIDACANERRTRLFQEAIASISSNPVRTLVNTHSHMDHTYGNCLFADDAVIVGHRNCRDDILRDAPDQRERVQVMFPTVEWGEVTPVAPNVVFDDTMTLYAGDLELQLIYVSPAHTNTDAVVWIPERKVLIAGDIIFNQGTPFALMGSVAGWRSALVRLKELPIKTVVAGHGPVADASVLDEVDAYLEFVQDSAKSAFDAGVDPLEAARDLDLGRFGEWTDRERIVGNLHRAYSELRGEELGANIDMATAFGQMLEFNGGQPLRCLA